MKLHTQLFSTLTLTVTLSLGLLGCGESGTDQAGTDGNRNTPSSADAAAVPAGLFLAEAPEGATPVTELRASAKEGDEVVMHVYVGGSKSPMVAGRSVMTVVDASVNNTCTTEDDHCATPWDYCCDLQDAQKAMATVQVVDADGRPLALDLGNGVGPLALLTVKGTVGKRVSADALVVNATGIFVEQAAQ